MATMDGIRQERQRDRALWAIVVARQPETHMYGSAANLIRFAFGTFGSAAVMRQYMSPAKF